MSLKKQSEKAPAVGEKGQAAPRGEARGGTAAIAQTAVSPSQLDLFESAIRLFRGGRFQEAREFFEKASTGPERGIADRAALHMCMCDRRLKQAAVSPQNLEEHYNYAVTLINSRDLQKAREHLRMAAQMDSNADHVYYALALCDGLAGDLQSAYENLKRAIELQPRNRITARQDADFATFANQAPLDRLLFSDKK